MGLSDNEFAGGSGPRSPLPIGPFLVLRRSFLQPPQRGGGAGPLAAIVRGRRSLALDLLLVAHAVRQETGSNPSATANEWLAAAGRTPSRTMASSVTRAWNWLADEGLVRIHAGTGRRAVEVLCEDGSGEAWTPAAGEDDPAFLVPAQYFDVALHRPIDLAAKAVLLIALSLQPSDDNTYFELPVDRGASWYGLPRGTVRRGLQELRELRIVHTWVEKTHTPLSPIGVRYDRRHRLVDLSLAAWRLAHPLADDGENGSADQK